MGKKRPVEDPDLPVYRTILCAVDGSPLSYDAARHAFAIARQSSGTVVLVYVVDSHAAYRLGVHQIEALRELEREGREILAGVAREAARYGAHVKQVIRRGIPGIELIACTVIESADLVVVGAHSRSRVGRALLGSVSEYVIRHARLPVLVVNETDVPREKGAGPAVTRIEPRNSGDLDAP